MSGFDPLQTFVRVHTSLRTSPPMAAGIVDELWSMQDVVLRIDQRFPPPSGPRGPYRKRANAAKLTP
jgi:hypothetical protein